MTAGRSHGSGGWGSGEAGRTATQPPHAPERGRLARLLGPLHVTGLFWYKSLAFGARRSETFKRIMLPLATAVFFLFLHSIRRAVTVNLAAALGPARFLVRQRRVWRTLHCFAWSQTERYERLMTDLPFVVESVDRAEWERSSAAGSGLILVTGHVGNWETASTLPATDEGRVIHVVREEELDPKAQQWVADRLRARLGGGYHTHFAHGDPFLGLALREALERGDVVALQGDRPRQGGGAVEVELFGRPYALPVGPLVLARQTGVPLLPAFVHRTGRRRYQVVFHPPVEVARSADRRADLLAAGRRLAAELEAAILRTPHQWYVFRALWR